MTPKELGQTPKRRKLRSQQTRILCSGCDQVTTYDKTTLLIASHRMPLAKKKCERSRKTATNEEILAGWYRNGEVARSYKPPLKPGASQSIKTISGGLPGTRRGH